MDTCGGQESPLESLEVLEEKTLICSRGTFESDCHWVPIFSARCHSPAPLSYRGWKKAFLALLGSRKACDPSSIHSQLSAASPLYVWGCNDAQFATRGPVLPSSKHHRRVEAAVCWDPSWEKQKPWPEVMQLNRASICLELSPSAVANKVYSALPHAEFLPPRESFTVHQRSLTGWQMPFSFKDYVPDVRCFRCGGMNSQRGLIPF